MELNELIIRRESWSESKPVRGKIEFSNPTGKVEINLTEQHCQKILEVVADALVEQAQSAANDLRAAVIEAAAGRQLEHRE